MLEGEPMSMWQLASYHPQQKKIALNQRTLSKIQQFSLGQIFVICNQGFQAKGFNVHRGYSRTKKNRDTSTGGNSIWIRPQPVYDQYISRYIFFMDLQANDFQAMEVLHMFASLISYAVIVVTGQEQSVAHFGYIGNHLKQGHTYNQRMKNNTAHLICLIPKYSEGPEFQDQTAMILNKLEIEGIEQQTLKVHPTVKGYQVASYSLMNSSRTLEDSIITQIQYILKGEKGNSELMYGHIFVQYILNIVEQINKNGKVDLTKIQDQIEIDGAYDAYMAGVKKHSQHSLSKLRNIEQPDDNMLIEVLDQSKKKAMEEYFSRGGAKNTQFRNYLQHYIENVNQRTLQNYSLSQRNKNLQILQAESQYVLQKIQTNNLGDKNDLIEKQIDLMKATYESQARGPQKFSIYNDYMKTFLPIAFSGDKKKQEDLRRTIKRNQQLKKKRDELKKNKKGCCSSCSLM